MIEECRAGDTIDIVVAVNDQRATRTRGRIHDGNRFAHVLELEWIVCVIRRRREKRRDNGGVFHRTRSEETHSRWWDARVSGFDRRRAFVGRADHPAIFVHSVVIERCGPKRVAEQKI